MSKNERMVGISRRTLVKSTAIGSLALAAGSFSLPFTLRNAAAWQGGEAPLHSFAAEREHAGLPSKQKLREPVGRSGPLTSLNART